MTLGTFFTPQNNLQYFAIISLVIAHLLQNIYDAYFNKWSSYKNVF